jgi:hypothetical protein
MSKFGVAPTEDLPVLVDGEVERIFLGEYAVVELGDEFAEGFPGAVHEDRDEAVETAARLSGVVANPEGEVPAPGERSPGES